MSYPRIIRNFNVFADGISYFGLAREAKLPDLKIMTAAHRGAGMDGPVAVDMGVEGLSAEITFAEWPPEILTSIGTIKRWVFRPAGRSDEGADQTNIVTMAGLITEHGFGGLKAGDESLLKVKLDLRQFRLEQDNVVMWDVNLESGKRVVGGVDQNATLRRSMGL